MKAWGIILKMDRETKLDIIEISRGYAGAILLAVLMYAGVVGAMYAGDSMSFSTNLTNPVYTVIGNESNMEGLGVTFDNGNITISPAFNFKPDNFTLVFFDNITNEVVKTIHTSSSGRSRTKYVDKNVTVYVPEHINTDDGINRDVVIGGEVCAYEPCDGLEIITEEDNLWKYICFTIGFSILIFHLSDVVILYRQRKREEKDITTLE